jgi:hypothetical protein
LAFAAVRFAAFFVLFAGFLRTFFAAFFVPSSSPFFVDFLAAFFVDFLAPPRDFDLTRSSWSLYLPPLRAPLDFLVPFLAAIASLLMCILSLAQRSKIIKDCPRCFFFSCSRERFESSKSKSCVDTIDCFGYSKLALHTTRGLHKNCGKAARCEIITHRALLLFISPPCSSHSVFIKSFQSFTTCAPIAEVFEAEPQQRARRSSSTTLPTLQRCSPWC